MALYFTYQLPPDVWVGDTVTHLILKGSGLIQDPAQFLPLEDEPSTGFAFDTPFNACFEGTQLDSWICFRLGLGEALIDWSIDQAVPRYAA